MLQRFSVSRCCCGPQTIACANCQNNQAAAEYSTALSGAAANPTAPIDYDVLDIQKIVDWYNSTHLMPEYLLPCTWRAAKVWTAAEIPSMHNKGSGANTTLVQLSIQSGNIVFQIDDSWGDSAFWDLSAPAPHDCLSNLSVPFQVVNSSPVVLWPTPPDPLTVIPVT